MVEKLRKESIEELKLLWDIAAIYGKGEKFDDQNAKVERYATLLYFMDSAEFEARVAQKLLTLDCEDIPCGHGMTIFCPNPPFKNKDCGAWCLLREARL